MNFLCLIEKKDCNFPGFGVIWSKDYFQGVSAMKRTMCIILAAVLVLGLVATAIATVIA